eukprot:2998109-Rhodomonas_salina.1
MVVHGHPHCRKGTLCGPDQGQELHVLVPVEGGVGVVLGPDSVWQRLMLERAPLVLPRARAKGHMCDGDVTDSCRNVGTPE